MKKTQKLLGVTLVLLLMLCFSFSALADEVKVWDGTTDTTWYSKEETSFDISTPAQLAGLAKLVNEGTDTFMGKTITLTADLDLGGKKALAAWDS